MNKKKIKMFETSTFSNDKLYVPKSIQEHLGLKNKDSVLWSIKSSNEVIIKTNKIPDFINIQTT